MPVDEVLTHGFVSPIGPCSVGRGLARRSMAGGTTCSPAASITSASLKVIEATLLGGRALAYLPDYYAKSLGVAVLNITGCPYSCTQTVKLVAPGNRKTSGWIQQIF